MILHMWTCWHFHYMIKEKYLSMAKQFSRDCLCACKLVILPFCIYCNEIKMYQTLSMSVKYNLKKSLYFQMIDWVIWKKKNNKNIGVCEIILCFFCSFVFGFGKIQDTLYLSVVFHSKSENKKLKFWAGVLKVPVTCCNSWEVS